MIHYLLDTNICIYIIKRKPESVFARFRELQPGTVGISSITMAELQYGIEKSSKPDQNQQALHQFLLPLEILGFDSIASVEYGKIRISLEKKGMPIGSLDMLIAAHAKSLDSVLVTNNMKEFERVTDLNVENWV